MVYWLFLFLVERLWKCEEDEATQRRRSKTAADRFPVNNDTIETVELNEKAEKVQKPEEAADIIKEYEEILHTKRKGIITIAYHQGKVFSRFLEKNKFTTLVRRFGIHKNTIVFKINVFKLISKHPRLMKSYVTLKFLKNYLKDIRQICQKNVSEFD